MNKATNAIKKLVQNTLEMKKKVIEGVKAFVKEVDGYFYGA